VTVAAGATTGVASFLPWATITDPFLSTPGSIGYLGTDAVSASGVGFGPPGDVTVVLGLAVAALGLMALLLASVRRSILFVACTLACCVVVYGLVTFADAGRLLGIGDVMSGIQPETAYAVEPGLYLVIASGIVAGLASAAGVCIGATHRLSAP
jgi:hypothetical protein